jgi:hypothetical protein
LNFGGAEEHGLPAQFPNADLETRVRVEDLAKSSAQICPASGFDSPLPRSFFIFALAARMCSKSARDNFSMLNKCFMGIILRQRIR